jgi:hypothetical protein
MANFNEGLWHPYRNWDLSDSKEKKIFSIAFRLKWASKAFREVFLEGRELTEDLEMDIPEDLLPSYIRAKKLRILSLEPQCSSYELQCLRIGDSHRYWSSRPKSYVYCT